MLSCSSPICDDAVKGSFKDLNGLDGCGMVITLDNDSTIIPVNLENFTIEVEDGNQVWVKYTELKDAMGICMAGQMVEIDCISDR